MRVLYHGSATLKAHGFAELDDSIRSLLKKIGDEIVELKDEKPMTDVLFNLGYREQAKEVGLAIKKEAEALKPDLMISAYGVTPYVWEFSFPETFDFKMSFPVLHIGEYLQRAIGDKKLKFKETEMKKVFLHHGCTPARKLNIIEQPRHFYNQIPNLEYIELNTPPVDIEGEDPAKWTTCTGVWQNMTLDDEMACYVCNNMLRREVDRDDVEAVATTCACAYKGLVQGLSKGEHKLKPLYFTELIEEAWRD